VFFAVVNKGIIGGEPEHKPESFGDRSWILADLLLILLNGRGF
jgi:hypothetical protein